MGFVSTGDDQGPSRGAQGYWSPTERAKRAEADGRARRVHAVLAKPAPPAWVAAEFRPSDFDGVAQATSAGASLSPAALAHRRRAAKLSLGFRCQILEQLAEERARLAERLQSLAAACDGAIQTHSSASPAGSSAASPKARLAGRNGSGTSEGRHARKQLGAAASAAVQGRRTPSPPAAVDSTSDLDRTPRRLPTPATAFRPAAASGAVVAATATAGLRGPSPSSPAPTRKSLPLSRGSTAVAAAAAAASGASTPTRAAGPAVGRAGGPMGRFAAPSPPPPTGPSLGARRRLSFQEAARDDAWLWTATGTSRPVGLGWDTASAVSSSPRKSPTFTGSPTATPSLPRAPAPAAWGASGLASAPPQAPAGEEVPRRLAWQDPVNLLPADCLHKFADARDGLWPRNQEPYALQQYEMAYDAPHLGHRERLRVGIAELNAELQSSWRALVASGAV